MIKFKLLSALLCLAVSVPALAEIQFAIGEPVENSTKSGIGQISGWAVSDVPIVSVEAFIDGVSVGVVPYGGTRLDVAAAFPEVPDSEFSGWSMKWNYSLLTEGEHVVTVVVTDEENTEQSKDVIFNTTKFRSEFISDPKDMRTGNAVLTILEDGHIVIEEAEVEGELVDIELAWDTGSQQFQISNIIFEEPEKENQAPTADAGPSLNADTGATVVIEGSGYDPDGSVESYSWRQVSGTAVNLLDANTQIVQFTAPEEAGTIRLRLTVTDDSGAIDKDDTLIEIIAPPPEPEPENQAPTANAGSDQTVDQGDSVTVPGSGNDPDGAIASWFWAQVSGPTASLSNADGQNVQFTAPDSAGDIRLRLTVTDDDGATDSDDVIITVEEPAATDATTGETVSSMLSVINDARGQAQTCGDTEYPAQDPLIWDGDLATIARLHSMDMAREGYFSHISLNGTSMGDRVFPYWSGGNRVGENIAASSIDRSNSYVVGLWMDSPGHCALIMDPDFTHAGIGAGHNSENGYSMHHFWTLDFGG